MQRYCTISGALFTVITAAWTFRLLTATPVTVDGWEIPVAISVIPIMVAGSLAVWAFRLAVGGAAAAKN